MTSKKAKTLAVVYAADALKELDAIWDWNEKTYGREHAAKYVGFLDLLIETLSTDHHKGIAISSHPELRYFPLKFSSRGHGHVAVYSIDQQSVNLLHIFHTAQDWQARLAAEYGASSDAPLHITAK